MDQLAEELNFPFKRCGKVLVGNTPEDMEQLERTMKQGAVNGCTGLEMIDEAKLHELVPAVVGKFAMWSKNSGIMDRSCTRWLWPRTPTQRRRLLL